MAPERWIDKWELATRLGLVDKSGKPQVYSINRKCATGEWDSHLVMGQLRFSPDDVAAIEKLLRHPAVKTREAQAAPEPTMRRRRDSTPKTSGSPTKPARSTGFDNLQPRVSRRTTS